MKVAVPERPTDARMAPAVATLDNSVVRATFDARGLASIALLAAAATDLKISGDAFRFSVDNHKEISSLSLPEPKLSVANGSYLSYTFTTDALRCVVAYSLRPSAAFVTKRLSISALKGHPAPGNATNVTLFADVVVLADGVPPASTMAADRDVALFLRWPARQLGALFTAQNPYLSAQAGSPPRGTSLSYAPMAAWPKSGVFAADAAHVGVHMLTNRTLHPPAQPLDEAEHEAMLACVRSASSAPPRSTSVKINIGWCENDYQLDIARAGDRAEYKRIIDRAAQLGLTHILFAPRNSDVSSRANNSDAWGWEQILWFGMGQRLRMGLWRPGDALPDSLVEMLDYFAAKGVKPVAYVYPILSFLAGTLPGGRSPEWIVNGTYLQRRLGRLGRETTGGSRGPPPDLASASGLSRGPLRSSLASEAFQEWLPSTLLAFANETGAGGFSFDYTYFEEGRPGGRPWESQYAQWSGWRAILRRLQVAGGCAGSQCVVDNRQSNHAWGAWMWSEGGTYAEPLASDEQPGSWMFYEADLKTDRLSANHQREVAYSYQAQFCPPEQLPGFAFHQTDRDASPNARAAPCADGVGRCANASRRRDFDLLGYRYSLLSAIGTGGLNNVVNMLPARDAEEFARLPKEDVGFIRRWLEWTDAHAALLRLGRPLPAMGRPAEGVLDGVGMVDAQCEGVVFVHNPSAMPRTLALPIDASLTRALRPGCAASGGLLLVSQIGSSDRNEPPGGWHRLLVRQGGTLNLTVGATTALVLELRALRASSPVVARGTPLLLGAPGEAVYAAATRSLAISDALGEAGTAAHLEVLLPKSLVVGAVSVNGKPVAFASRAPPAGVGLDELVLLVVDSGLRWAGEHFARGQPIGTSSGFAGGVWRQELRVPPAVLTQLRARNASYDLDYDLDPNGNDEANVPWLAPGRLLVFAKYRPLVNDSFNASGDIDGVPLVVRRAYNTIVPSASRFIGWWADVTRHVTPGTRQVLTLHLPGGGEWGTRVGDIGAGNDVDVLQSATVHDAQGKCAATARCVGLTFELAGTGAPSCAAAIGSGARPTKVYLKSSSQGGGDRAWCTVLRPPILEGVHFDNVETIYSRELTG